VYGQLRQSPRREDIMDKILLNEHERLVESATLAPAAFKHALEEIEEIEKALNDIDGKTCTGTEYWRDQDHPTRSPKLYVIHGTGESCPLHGEPEDGGRIRTYIGADQQAIAEARAAMEREREREQLEERLDALRYGIVSAAGKLDRALMNVGFRVEGGELKRGRVVRW
jgi:hypothetical protein